VKVHFTQKVSGCPCLTIIATPGQAKKGWTSFDSVAFNPEVRVSTGQKVPFITSGHGHQVVLLGSDQDSLVDALNPV
jgi:plastocyanin